MNICWTLFPNKNKIDWPVVASPDLPILIISSSFISKHNMFILQHFSESEISKKVYYRTCYTSAPLALRGVAQTPYLPSPPPWGGRYGAWAAPVTTARPFFWLGWGVGFSRAGIWPARHARGGTRHGTHFHVPRAESENLFNQFVHWMRFINPFSPCHRISYFLTPL